MENKDMDKEKLTKEKAAELTEDQLDQVTGGTVREMILLDNSEENLK